ncbi:MAG: hypothetical protein GXP33_13095 [Spirochaetes bacterium]|nr:hypothetical protein [Spirochaetota bacterium]
MDSTTAADPAYSIENRKYLGSKKNLKGWILDTIVSTAGDLSDFLDGFCGTGAISGEALLRGFKKVTAVDNLSANTVILKAFYNCRVDKKDADSAIDYLNNLRPAAGYITSHFSGSYFIKDNCMIMDAVRDEIERLFTTGEIDAELHDYLVAGFILSADRVSNTIGQYDAYLKHIGSPSVKEGRHLVDTRVYSRFRLKSLKTNHTGNIKVVTGDILTLADSINADTAYYDPPYNCRQYFSNYHLLENLAGWNKPPVFGKTKKYRHRKLLSPFSRKRDVKDAFNTLLARTKANRIFISYSSEGLLSVDELAGICKKYGTITLFSYPYRIFGNGAGISVKREITEYLIFIRRNGNG